MAILLGVADVVLEQAQAPALAGGGEVVIGLARETPPTVVLSGILRAAAFRDRVRQAAPFARDRLFLIRDTGTAQRVDARGGIPSAERALGDRETSGVDRWRDTADDQAWLRALPEAGLGRIDAFHPIPDAPDWHESWAEWLYFNGRGKDARFYLTFLVGPRLDDGRRAAGVRLQLERDGRTESYSGGAAITEAEAMAAPNLTIGRSGVRLVGLQYRISLHVTDASGRTAVGSLTLDAAPERLLPPIEIAGARGWRTGYVVPVMSGPLSGQLTVNGVELSLDGTGYHDHNWGFWRGVSWRWGQTQHGDLSVIYGRVIPPPDAVDPARMPGIVGVLGPDGPLGYATDVRIVETRGETGAETGGETGGESRGRARGETGGGRPDGQAVRPTVVHVTARGRAMDLRLQFDVESAVTTQMREGPLGNGLQFLQLRGQYRVSGRVGDQAIAFTAPGAAETFRGR